MVMTVGSVVFCPEDGLVWVATGEAPTSRNRFVAFDLRGERRAHEAPSFSVDDGESAEARRAFARYRDAYVLHLDHGDASGARDDHETAARLPTSPRSHGRSRGADATLVRARTSGGWP
jgi:hypothetical protein